MKNVLLACLFLLAPVLVRAEEFTVKSPDNRLAIAFALRDGSPFYRVNYDGKEVVLESPLGINGNGDWNRNLQILGNTSTSHMGTYQLLYGERTSVPDNYNGRTVRLGREKSKFELEIEFRAYNEGVAFRYHFLEGGSYLHIDREYTEFALPEGTWAWHTPMAQTEYTKLPLRDWPTETDRPLTLELPNGLYACLAEAQVVDYCRTKYNLSAEKPNTLVSAMYGFVDEIAPFTTPWRVVMVAEQPGQLLENNYLLLNLNPANAIEHPWWIKPGKVMREIQLTTKAARELVDFAVKRNLDYIHFDAGWYGHEYHKSEDASFVSVDPDRNPVNDLDMGEVVRYANQRGVGVWLYVNQRALAAQLDELLPIYQSWGIKGLKFGFVQVGSHMWTKWMHDAVKKCAEYQIMVDIHDEYRPTGFSRTYPNLLTQEGVRGNEEMPDARTNLIQPFTRFVAGAADATICYYYRDFDNYDPQHMDTHVSRRREIKNTSGHQLAIAVVYYSPLQFMYWYDRPSDVGDEPELEFFDRVPTVWDDTRVLHGEIGEYITVARRSGRDWFVGSMTGLEGRDLKVALNFLEPGKKYKAHIYRDGSVKTPTRTKVIVETRIVDATSVLLVKLYPSGGQAMWIEALN